MHAKTNVVIQVQKKPTEGTNHLRQQLQHDWLPTDVSAYGSKRILTRAAM